MASPDPGAKSGSDSKNPQYRWRNLAIAIAAILLSATLFFVAKLDKSAVSLAALANSATPFETAIANQKPTLIEFYADWCTSCQSMAPDNLVLQKEYGDRFNFVMLNVDNNKWSPEMNRYQVDGIPHFVYMDKANQVLGNAIGVMPRLVMASNLDAVLGNLPLPYTQVNYNQRSAISEQISEPEKTSTAKAMPMDHGKAN